jgi:isopentenyl diphosphate isomerase/L-lactate dehydrogenase-like FMN-dependent dehydrogenase
MMAPIGSLQTITPEGGRAVAKAAAEFGTMNFLSSVTQPALEEVATCTDHPKIFQLYIRGGLDWCAEIVGRVKQAGLHRALSYSRYGALQPARAAVAQPLGSRPADIGRAGRIYQAMLTWEWQRRSRKLPACR